MKIACLLKKELNLGEVEEWFWTDSKVVLGYIKNDVRGFKTFVANRIQQIRENTEVQQRQYVPTRENPADDASRGLNAERVHSRSRWFQGPLLLWHNEKDWPVTDIVDVEVHVDDPELKKEAKSYAAVIH